MQRWFFPVKVSAFLPVCTFLFLWFWRWRSNFWRRPRASPWREILPRPSIPVLWGEGQAANLQRSKVVELVVQQSSNELHIRRFSSAIANIFPILKTQTHLCLPPSTIGGFEIAEFFKWFAWNSEICAKYLTDGFPKTFMDFQLSYLLVLKRNFSRFRIS